MLQLNNLEKLVSKRKRVGRGGKWGTSCGRGKGGQKSRTGSNSDIKPPFEGGQMPLTRRLPQRGFTNVFKKEFTVVNLEDLELRFDDGATVDSNTLREKGLLKGKRSCAVKILGVGALSKKLIVNADAFSKPAREAIEKIGGKAQLIQEMNRGGVAS